MKIDAQRFVCAAIILIAAMCSLGAPAIARADNRLQRQTINIQAGETQVIDHVKTGSAPVLRVIENPHALVVHGEEPGKLVILGAERGRFEITVQRDDGTTVVYQVNVAAIADFANPLAPGAAPAAIADGIPPAAAPSPAGSAGAGSAEPTNAAAPSGTSAPGAPAGDYTATWSMEPPGAGEAPVRAGESAKAAATPNPAGVSRQQAAASAESEAGPVRRDPPIAEHGGGYLSPSVSGGPNYLPEDGLSLMIGTSQVIDFARRMKRISIADSSIADVQVVSPYQLNLVAHKPGFTTLAVWDEQGHYEERQVRIDPAGKQQVMLNVIVTELNRSNLENQGINYSAALTNYGLSIVGLPGAVATPFSQQASSSGSGSSVLPPGGNIIPLLLSQNLTYALAGQNSNVVTQTFFQYLEQHNLARILAEPHLLANSGEEAKFLSGGEIPIVIAQALNTSIVFKQFGTQVVFVPTVVGSRDIELAVEPEVSQPDYAHGVELFGFQVPAFITRRAKTMVRLSDNQTLIIAGLILHDKRAVVQKVPYLGDIPYAGGLFRNTNWQDSESDLVMAVTPQIVRPLPAESRVFLPSQRGPLSSEEVRTQRPAVPDASRPRF